MEDVSMVAQIEGFKHEQLLFVDEVLKQLGELAFLVVFFNQWTRFTSWLQVFFLRFLLVLSSITVSIGSRLKYCVTAQNSKGESAKGRVQSPRQLMAFM